MNPILILSLWIATLTLAGIFFLLGLIYHEKENSKARSLRFTALGLATLAVMEVMTVFFSEVNFSRFSVLDTKIAAVVLVIFSAVFFHWSDRVRKSGDKK